MDPSRISLRAFRLSDADDLLKWASDDEVTLPHPWRRSICIDDRSVGYVSIRPGRSDGRDQCRGNLGYAVGKEFWGLGIATGALKMAIGDAFKDIPDLVRVQALVEVENRGSQRVLEKVGFEREGLLRNYGYCNL